MSFYSFPYIFQVCKRLLKFPDISIFFLWSIFFLVFHIGHFHILWKPCVADQSRQRRCGEHVQDIQYNEWRRPGEQKNIYIQPKHFPFSLMITTTHICSAWEWKHTLAPSVAYDPEMSWGSRGRLSNWEKFTFDLLSSP